MKRRDIIKNGTLTGAAVLLPASGAFAASGEVASHKSVLSGLSAYSGRVLPVVGKKEVHVLASIDRMSSFLDAALHQALPYENMRAEGNVISFTLGETAYTVENVLPQHFEKRAQALS